MRGGGLPKRGKLDHLFWKELKEAIQEEQAAAQRRARTVRNWRAIWTHVTAVPDVVYPFDPAVWRAIREFDPNTMILMTKRAYRAKTGGVEVFRYHTLSSHRWSPKNRPDYRLQSVLTPTWCNMPQPTHIDLHLENRRERRGDGLPGAFIPFDWRVYHALRSSYREWEFKDLQRFVEQHGEAARARRAREAALARVAERVKKDDKWLKERFGRIDRHDAERLIAEEIEGQKRKAMVQVA